MWASCGYLLRGKRRDHVAGARLKDLQIKKAKPSDKPYKLFDGGGMFLYVTPTGAKVWRWQFRFNGKYQQMSLGPYQEVSMEEARLKIRDKKEFCTAGVTRWRSVKKRKGAASLHSKITLR